MRYNGVSSAVAVVASGREWCGLVSLLRSPRDDSLATLSPLWRISDVIVLGQAGDFVPAQVGIRMRESASLDLGDLG